VLDDRVVRMADPNRAAAGIDPTTVSDEVIADRVARDECLRFSSDSLGAHLDTVRAEIFDPAVCDEVVLAALVQIDRVASGLGDRAIVKRDVPCKIPDDCGRRPDGRLRLALAASRCRLVGVGKCQAAERDIVNAFFAGPPAKMRTLCSLGATAPTGSPY